MNTEELSREDLLTLRLAKEKHEFRVCLVGKIVEVYPEERSVDIELVNKMVRPSTIYRTRTVYNYPFLLKRLTVMQGGSRGFLHTPLTIGDACLVLFLDEDTDDFLDNGSLGSEPTNNEKHTINNAIVLTGILPANQENKQYSADETRLNYQNSNVVLNDKIGVWNETEDLKAILTDLIDALKGLTIETANLVVTGTAPVGGGPIPDGKVIANASVLASSQNELAEIATRLGNLLADKQ